MRKSKLWIKVALITVVIIIIIILVKNFNTILFNYENKVVEYDNNYIKEDSEKEFLDYVKSATYRRNLNDESQCLKNNKLYMKFIMGDALDDKNVFLQNNNDKTVLSDLKTFLIPDTNYGDIIYIEENFYEGLYGSYILIYNEDVNKIYYKVSFENEELTINKEFDEDIEKIKETIKKEIDELNINITNFAPNVTQEKNTYILEDENNNIKIKYNISKERIIELFWDL